MKKTLIQVQRGFIPLAILLLVGAFVVTGIFLFMPYGDTFAQANPSWNEGKILASDGETYDNFGYAVDISGDTIIVGAKEQGESSSNSTYMYRWTGSEWSDEIKFIASDVANSAPFGQTVAINGDRAVVGLWADNENGEGSGVVYVYKRDGSIWNLETKLYASDAKTTHYFGKGVDISGDTIIVGAFGDNDYAGAAYIYRWNGSGWTEAKISDPDGASSDRFGESVAISGDTAIVGAWGDDGFDGSACIYRWNGSGWIFENKLLPTHSGQTYYAGFGQSVAISGDTAIVGASGDDDNGGNAGAAYIYRWDGSNWVLDIRLLGPQGVSEPLFGESVAISGDTAIIGVRADVDGNGIDSGSAHIYRWNGSGWIFDVKVTPSNATGADSFGHAVAIDGNKAIVGAYLNNENGENAGAAYVYEYATCGNNILETGEECDDGNTLPGDGCSATCQTEPCYNVTLTTQAEVNAFDGFTCPNNEITGNLKISGGDITDISGIDGINSIEGDLRIEDNDLLASLAGLPSLTSVGGDLYIAHNPSLPDLTSLSSSINSVGRNLIIFDNQQLTDLNGLGNIATIGSDVRIVNNYSLTSLAGLHAGLTEISENLSIRQNDALTDLNGLPNINRVGRNLDIYQNFLLTSLSGLDNVNSIGLDLNVQHNNSLVDFTGLDSLNSITGNLFIFLNSVLESLNGLDNLTSVGKDLRIGSNDILDKFW
jgi:cysteine-rich repeat protein